MKTIYVYSIKLGNIIDLPILNIIGSHDYHMTVWCLIHIERKVMNGSLLVTSKKEREKCRTARTNPEEAHILCH